MDRCEPTEFSTSAEIVAAVSETFLDVPEPTTMPIGRTPLLSGFTLTFGRRPALSCSTPLGVVCVCLAACIASSCFSRWDSGMSTFENSTTLVVSPLPVCSSSRKSTIPPVIPRYQSRFGFAALPCNACANTTDAAALTHRLFCVTAVVLLDKSIHLPSCQCSAWVVANAHLSGASPCFLRPIAMCSASNTFNAS